jgi:thiol-disulfide isomerase/thioredoxin
MTEETNPKFSHGRFYALIMIGTGLLAIGVISLLLLKDYNAASPTYTESSAVPVEVDFPAPQLAMLSLDGRSVSLLDYRGRVVLVNLWATWCPPCREEMPALQAFYEKHREAGFVLVGLNQEETRAVVEPFVREFGLTFPIWLDEDYLAQREFNTISLPSSYVIDRDGRVRLMWLGRISNGNLEKFVSPVIAK